MAVGRVAAVVAIQVAAVAIQVAAVVAIPVAAAAEAFWIFSAQFLTEAVAAVAIPEEAEVIRVVADAAAAAVGPAAVSAIVARNTSAESAI